MKDVDKQVVELAPGQAAEIADYGSSQLSRLHLDRKKDRHADKHDPRHLKLPEEDLIDEIKDSTPDSGPYTKDNGSFLAHNVFDRTNESTVLVQSSPFNFLL